MNPGDTKRKRALVIEDEPIISRVCRKILTAEGFDVDLAANGLIAKEMVAKKEYDLCLSDVRTPEMNGMEFYAYIEKEFPVLANKVVFTTGDVFSGNINIFLKTCKRPFLQKPFLPDELKKIVRKI